MARAFVPRERVHDACRTEVVEGDLRRVDRVLAARFRMGDQWRLKYCTSRSCFSAATRDLKVPRFRLFPVLGSFFLEWSRYPPDFSFSIMWGAPFVSSARQHVAMQMPPGDRSFLLTPSSVDSVATHSTIAWKRSGSFLMPGRRDAMSRGPLDEHGQPLFEVSSVVTFVEQAGGTIQTVRGRIRRVSPD